MIMHFHIYHYVCGFYLFNFDSVNKDIGNKKFYALY